VIKELNHKVKDFIGIEVKESQVPISHAVSSYLFNSQLVTLQDGTMALIAPIECQQSDTVRDFLLELSSRTNHPITQFNYMNLRESMRNGGGPACLRLRVVLTEAELAAMHPAVIFDDILHAKLINWVNRHYRDRLIPNDLSDPLLLIESRAALDELTKILELGSIYHFQG
jgi:succinylarginine dihydrolase